MPYNEELLHYIWKSRLYASNSLVTVQGDAIEVIDPGMHNQDGGPDFFNAKIRIGDTLWAGDVEIHRTSDEWKRHGHHTDKLYNSVILHLSEHVNAVVVNEKGQQVPQCKLSVPDKIRENATYLLYSHKRLPCHYHISSLSSIFIRSLLSTLGVERLERKVNDIYRHLDHYCQSWDDVFYLVLMRNFGFGLNSDAFERLAFSLPFKYIRRHGDNLFQIEALMFGQAGLLESNEFTGSGKKADDYFIQLQREYDFLQRKYGLSPLNGYLFKRMRVRPSSFPEIRIAQLTALLQSSGRLFSKVLEQKEIDGWMSLFRVSPSGYWRSHYSFGRMSPESDRLLGNTSLQVLLINTVAPILFAYGKKSGIENYCEKAISLLESLYPEKNAIVSEFRQAGIYARNAFDTQALVQLRKVYCDQRKCLFCNIGRIFLTKRK